MARYHFAFTAPRGDKHLYFIPQRWTAETLSGGEKEMGHALIFQQRDTWLKQPVSGKNNGTERKDMHSYFITQRHT